MNCNNKITKPLVFKALSLLILLVVITDGAVKTSLDVSILGV